MASSAHQSFVDSEADQSAKFIDKLKDIDLSGGDVHSMHLINRIDRGIKDRKRFIQTP
jgi:hypothetical protein